MCGGCSKWSIGRGKTYNYFVMLQNSGYWVAEEACFGELGRDVYHIQFEGL